MRSVLAAETEDKMVLKNISKHLLTLAADTVQIGKCISELTSSLDAAPMPSTIHDLQKLDNLHQSLCDLAELSAALAGPDEQKIQAFNGLKLKSVRSLVPSANSDHATSHGSIDLF